jgi:hypothetical protein
MKSMHGFMAEISAAWLKRQAMRQAARSGAAVSQDRTRAGAPPVEQENPRQTRPHRPAPPPFRDIASNM